MINTIQEINLPWKTTRETAMPHEGQPWNFFHTQRYAESYKSRHKKYPPGYDPANPDPEQPPPEPERPPQAAKGPVNSDLNIEATKAAPFKQLTKECPAYYVNSRLANCEEIIDGNVLFKMTLLMLSSI
jgi:hypothetical protein